MASSTTTVDGVLEDATGAAVASEYVYFQLKQTGADNDVTPDTVYSRGRVEGLTNASGELKAADGTSDFTLWVNGESDIQSIYEITTKNRKIEPTEVIIPTSATSGTISIAELMINHVVSGSTTQQSTVLADAKAYTDTAMADPSANTSFVADPWIADLDVYVTGSVDGFFADPSTNGSFSASEWRSDLIAPTTSVTSTSYTTLATDSAILVDDDTAGSTVTITLLAAATAGNGFTLDIVKEGLTADVVVTGIGTLTEEGESITLKSDGTTYRVV